MESELDYWSLPMVLMERFPEVRAEVEGHLLSEWDAGRKLPPHELLEGYFLRLLISGCQQKQEELARRACAFLETLLGHTDEDLVSAALMNVLEPIRENAAWAAAARPYLGPRALGWSHELGKSKLTR
jgi:hypothetical protein